MTDHISEKKLIDFEKNKKSKINEDYFIHQIPR